MTTTWSMTTILQAPIVLRLFNSPHPRYWHNLPTEMAATGRSRILQDLQHVDSELKRIKAKWQAHMLAIEQRGPGIDGSYETATRTSDGLRMIHTYVQCYNTVFDQMRSDGYEVNNVRIDVTGMIRSAMRQPRGPETLGLLFKEAVAIVEDRLARGHLLVRLRTWIGIHIETLRNTIEVLIDCENRKIFQAPLELLARRNTLRQYISNEPNPNASYLRDTIEKLEMVDDFLSNDPVGRTIEASFGKWDVDVLKVLQFAARVGVKCNRQTLVTKYFKHV